MKIHPASRLMPAVGLAVALATCLVLAGQPPARPPAIDPEKQRKAIEALTVPWPDAKTVARRRVDAVNRRLFRSADPLTVTLRGDFNALRRDRDPESTKTFPGTMIVTGEGGQDVTIPITLRTRGAIRLSVAICEFPPIRVDLPNDGLKGTAFAGQDSLKLVPHCVNNASYEQFILRELLAYRMFNLFTPYSYRVRQAKVSYVDGASGRPVRESLRLLHRER